MSSIRKVVTILTGIFAALSCVASHAQSLELKTLQWEHDNVIRELTADYNAGLAKLDASYIAGIERSLAEAKSAGDLQAVLSLQEEAKRIAAKEALPANDEQAPAPLKKLRAIYRVELAKLDAQRATSQLAIFAPFFERLKKLEADLTRADRIDDAKAVMEYREGVATGLPPKVEVAANPPTPPSSAEEKPSFNPGKVRRFNAGSPAAILTSEEGKAKLAVVKVADGTWSALKEGAECYTGSKRGYQWDTVPVELENIQFSRLPAQKGVLSFSVEQPGWVFMATSTRWNDSGAGGAGPDALDKKGLEKQGWRHIPEFDKLSNTDTGKWMVFSRQCSAGESLSIRTEKYASPVILKR